MESNDRSDHLLIDAALPKSDIKLLVELAIQARKVIASIQKVIGHGIGVGPTLSAYRDPSRAGGGSDADSISVFPFPQNPTQTSPL